MNLITLKEPVSFALLEQHLLAQQKLVAQQCQMSLCYLTEKFEPL